MNIDLNYHQTFRDAYNRAVEQERKGITPDLSQYDALLNPKTGLSNFASILNKMNTTNAPEAKPVVQKPEYKTEDDIKKVLPSDFESKSIEDKMKILAAFEK